MAVKSADISLQKLPPQNIEAEQMVLGAVLIDNRALDEISDTLTPADFYRDAHADIYHTILAMHERREAVDLLTLSEALRQSGALEKTGGAAYLSELVSLVPTAANVKYHAAIVRDKALFRRTLRAAQDIIAAGYAEPQALTADEFIDRSEQRIFQIAQDRKGNDALVPMKDSVQEGWDEIERLYERQGSITGVPTGFADIDRMTAGLQSDELIIIAGRPSMGKTAFALNIAAHAAIAERKRTAVFSLEMSRKQLMTRLYASEGRVALGNIRIGRIAEDEWKKLGFTGGRLRDAGIWIDETPALTALDIRSRARRLMAQSGLDLIVIDYLQLMRGTGSEQSREQEVSGISRALKALSKELHVPVVALSQLNRSVESRPNKRPGLSDLRESGALEQDSDLIIFLYREEAYNACECGVDCICGRRGTAEAIVAKQRNGPTGKVHLTYLAQFTRFENAAK